ncbi:MAG: TetR/AcrR family transcriptional regulator, partial [Clostridiales bacterium]|nr:TetR/AcrR family transcriptional regulator [Clostridiales bacterium]
MGKHGAARRGMEVLLQEMQRDGVSKNCKKEDLRIVKTQKAITDAMSSLLERRAFGKITVYDICNEAMVSRAAFYFHF